jgi:hypothetical protein
VISVYTTIGLVRDNSSSSASMLGHLKTFGTSATTSAPTYDPIPHLKRIRFPAIGITAFVGSMYVLYGGERLQDLAEIVARVHGQWETRARPDWPLQGTGFDRASWRVLPTETNSPPRSGQAPEHGAVSFSAADVIYLARALFSESRPSTPSERVAIKRGIKAYLMTR